MNFIFQKIEDELLSELEIELSVLRLDLIHPQMGGNKYFKLKYNLLEAQKQNKNTLLTFGGAFSNHIYATAAAGKFYQFKTIGIIRGEETLPLNLTLAFARDCGMELIYCDREKYRLKNQPDFIEALKKQFGDFYLIPEGGSNALAVKGVSEIISNINQTWDYICTPCGTGSTMAGLIAGAADKGKVLGFAVLKGADFLFSDIQKLLADYDEMENKNKSILKKWDKHPNQESFETLGFTYHSLDSVSNHSINLNYHFGGYAKKTTTLLRFMGDFQEKYNIPLEWIYSGKMFYGIFDLIKAKYFPKGSKIIALHTGGLR